ncbi:MAG: DUF5668 domain-containing protein [Acidobacteriota bacterium]|nr:DUF5668 domain-containing protein [Acidobacteriota bacterium]
MEQDQKREKTANRVRERQVFWGLFLIIIGILFLLEQLNIIDFGQTLADYWPAIFILIGLLIYISRGFRKSASALFLILLGVFMILIKMERIERYLWPSLLILVGLWILFRPAFKKKV